jgi:hypothetical protein
MPHMIPGIMLSIIGSTLLLEHEHYERAPDRRRGYQYLGAGQTTRSVVPI